MISLSEIKILPLIQALAQLIFFRYCRIFLITNSYSDKVGKKENLYVPKKIYVVIIIDALIKCL